MGNKIYISGGISKVPNFLEIFEEAEEKLNENGFTPINPAKVLSALPEDETTHEEYMTVAFALLYICDSIYMLNGWEKSTGACMEYGFALAKDKKVYFESEE